MKLCLKSNPLSCARNCGFASAVKAEGVSV